MQRSRLKNIINKSKEMLVKAEPTVGEPYDSFLKTLPKELIIDENYRLKDAWKAYGSPKDFKEAVWNGMIQPIDENTYKFPSIGYNEETDEYEYLNKGKENETVAKDIRVWDNDVIPLVKELKQGGYIRVYNDEKDCWTYSKNSQNKEQPVEEQQKIEEFKQGGAVIPSGSLHAHKNHMQLASEGLITPKGIPVVSEENGEMQQQAEIEREEVIFDKQATTDIEKLYKKFNEADKQSEKDEIAIKAGKILTDIFINNTEDNTGLIEKVADKNNLEYNK